MQSVLFASLLLLGNAAQASATSYAPPSSCKCFPGDACWPSQKDWARLNSTVGGRLIATVPLASPCHDPQYNAAECKTLQDEWLYSTIHSESSSSVMAPLFANQSCDPFQPETGSCTLGNYVRYAVDAKFPADIAAALKFADDKNIRFVIRNTGHDYLGRSTGAGALAVWTHHLKSTKIINWNTPQYKGKALKLGAGVQGFEALEAAHAAGLAVVTGECPSVGLAGGYTQGGGHSALSTAFGLAADNTLEWEVVTPAGDVVTASRQHNSDLYWALSGGGPGNYGVVTSLTVRAHPDKKVGGAKFMVTAPTDKPEKIYDIINAFHAALPGIVDQGVMIIYFFSDSFLSVPAMTAYGKTQAQAEAILKPFVDSLAKIGVTLAPTYTGYSSYYDHYDHYWGPLPAGNIQVGTALFGGRLLPRNKLSSFAPTARKLAEAGVIFIGVGLDVSKFGGTPINAVLPQWRKSIVQVSLELPYNFTVPFADMVATQQRITDEIQPIIEAATPGAGAYQNEADFQQTNWQETFYGTNYNRLQVIKNKWDPKGLLYAKVAVGSEAWTVSDSGRMCKAKK
ncbi:hypothetical protein G7046_g3925 [Stylonectria norvegica]|nr:hypothetical protein G7046_g3925 [Stylonectria norvegica]